MSQAMEVPFTNPDSVLPGAQFADSYALTIEGQNLDAVSATKAVMGRNPVWISNLMQLRNKIVAPLGLKPAPDKKLTEENSIGTFPLISQSADQVVLGMNDKHLDFRIVVRVANGARGRQTITASTIVKTHNLLGRIYLGIVKPFHRLIVPTMLNQVVKGS
jgi:Protein of unknown function (DUF2867)